MSPALGVNGGDLVMRVERLITPHHAIPHPTPRLTSVMLLSALCLGGMLALASARNMPISAMQSFALPLPQLHQAAVDVLTPVLPPTRLLPTQVSAGELRTSERLVISLARFVPGSMQMEVPAPEPESLEPAAPKEPAQALPQTQIKGAALSSLLGQDGTVLNPLAINKRATAQTGVISLNGSSTPTSGHQYCEPITGSRVCN